MAYLDYFDPNEEDPRRGPNPQAPGGDTGSSAPVPASQANPGPGSATGAPDRPGATALPSPGSGGAGQVGTGFVGIGDYFAPNQEVAAQQTQDFLGGVKGPSTTTTTTGGGSQPYEDWAAQQSTPDFKLDDKARESMLRDAYRRTNPQLEAVTTTTTDPGTVGSLQQPGGVVGELQKTGGPGYSQGSAGLDAYLMGRSGLEGGLSALDSYFNPSPAPTSETGDREPRGPTKPLYDPEDDARRRQRYEGGY
jgi:hypothetical protein